MPLGQVGTVLAAAMAAALLAASPAMAQKHAGPGGGAKPASSTVGAAPVQGGTAAPSMNAGPGMRTHANRGANWNGANWNKAAANTGNWNHGDRRRGHRFHRGFVFGGPYWTYDDGYYDDGDYAVYEEAPGYVTSGVDVQYCIARFKSYDPASQTYLGYDGVRHPCP